MSTSVTNCQRAAKTGRVYLGVAAFCLVFSLIYEYYSHQVYSPYMVFLFSLPLLGGALPFLLLWLWHRRSRTGPATDGDRPYPGRLSTNTWHFGLATLTIGCCLRGVLDIYGTTSPLLIIYAGTGGTLLLVSLLSALRDYQHQRRRPS